MKTYEIRVKRALSFSKLPEYQYALNPYVGCLHGCLYCYAIEFTRGPPAAAWGDLVYVKVNLIEVLEREVKKVKPGVVGLSTITDPYIPPEVKYRIVRRALPILTEAGFRVSVQTKSGLVVRDVDLFVKYRDKIDVGITITTLSDKARILEPMASHPLARAAAVRKLTAAGVRTWIFLGPVIPSFNDSVDDIVGVVKLAAEVGAELFYDRYRPRPRANERLKRQFRDVSYDSLWWTAVKKRIERVCVDHGVRCIDVEEERQILPDVYKYV